MSLALFRVIVGRLVRRNQIRNFRKKARKANRRSIVVGEIFFEIRTAHGKGRILTLSLVSPRRNRVVIGWSTKCLSASIFNQFTSVKTGPVTPPPA
jgi:hypothetical protein